MFRRVTHTVLVQYDTCNLVDPPERNQQDQQEFDSMRETWQNNPQVHADQAAVVEKVNCYLYNLHL